MLSIGAFFNFFLPTSVGGDIFKAYYISKNSQGCNIEKSIFSVFFDRYIGLLVMLIAGGAGAIFLDVKVAGIQLSHVLFAIFLTLIFFNILIILYAERIDTLLERISIFKKILSNIFSKISKILNFIKKDKKLFLSIFVCSLSGFIMFCLMHYIFIYRIGGTNVFLPIIVFVSVTMLLAMIPISISGIGVRELTYIALFKTIDISPSISLAMSVLFYCIMLIFAIPGFIYFILMGRNR